jgi:hypothetical protein
MKKHTPAQNLPPLSLRALDSVQKIEEYAQLSLHSCGGEHSFNTPKALRILRACVVASLDEQLSFYSSLPGYCSSWLEEMKESTVYATTNLANHADSKEWEYLAAQLQRTIEDHLSEKQANAKFAIAKSKEEQSQKPLSRQKLKQAYFAKFDAKILDVCWAVGQHYREWKRWLNNEVKDGSKPDLAFRAILGSHKSPEQYNKKPRPSGWQ